MGGDVWAATRVQRARAHEHLTKCCARDCVAIYSCHRARVRARVGAINRSEDLMNTQKLRIDTRARNISVYRLEMNA